MIKRHFAWNGNNPRKSKVDGSVSLSISRGSSEEKFSILRICFDHSKTVSWIIAFYTRNKHISTPVSYYSNG